MMLVGATTRFDQREQLTRLLLEEANRCSRDDLRVTSQSDKGLWRSWTRSEGDPSYGYRTILPSQVTFDVGDGGDWARTRKTTHRIWTVLNRWDVPYWGSLSGGRGTHTTVFIRPYREHLTCDCSDPESVEEVLEVQEAEWHPHRVVYEDHLGREQVCDGEDLRHHFASAVVNAVASMEPMEKRLAAPSVAEYLDIDGTCLNPNPGAQPLREFGSRKPGARRKTLWTFGPGTFRRLPPDRTEAYKYRGVVIPESLPVAERPPGAKHHEHAAFVSGDCPQGPFCFPRPRDTGLAEAGLRCKFCPINR